MDHQLFISDELGWNFEPSELGAAFAHIERRTAPVGYPNADRVMETALLLPCSHGNTDAEIRYLHDCVDEFLRTSTHADAGTAR
jgi:CDP-6-deoxy-D-xylo-4-hexulose-3-dehydrase